MNTGRSDPDLRSFARKILQACLSLSNRIVQNAALFCFSPPLGKSLNNFAKIEGLSLVKTSFAPRHSPRPINNFWSCHPLPPVMGVTMIPNIHFLTTYYERYSWGTDLLFFFYLNQPVRQSNGRLPSRMMFGQIASGKNPGPSGPPNNWFRTLRDDLAIFLSTEGSTEDIPRQVGVKTVLCGSMQQIMRTRGTRGSSKKPSRSRPGGT